MSRNGGLVEQARVLTRPAGHRLSNAAAVFNTAHVANVIGPTVVVSHGRTARARRHSACPVPGIPAATPRGRGRSARATIADHRIRHSTSPESPARAGEHRQETVMNIRPLHD